MTEHDGVTAEFAYDWLRRALREHPGRAADPHVAERLAAPLAALINAHSPDDDASTCGVCGEVAVVRLEGMPLCVGDFDEGLRALRARVDRLEQAVLHGDPA